MWRKGILHWGKQGAILTFISDQMRLRSEFNGLGRRPENLCSIKHWLSLPTLRLNGRAKFNVPLNIRVGGRKTR